LLRVEEMNQTGKWYIIGNGSLSGGTSSPVGAGDSEKNSVLVP